MFFVGRAAVPAFQRFQQYHCGHGGPPPKIGVTFVATMQDSRILPIALLLLALLITLIPGVWRIPYQFSITYNEGWNTYHSDHAVNGVKLYDRSRELTPVIYPTLFFYLEGAVGKAIGNTLLAGRLLAILSLLGVGILCGMLALQLGRSIYAAIFSGAFCIGCIAAFAPQYVGMNDPQLTAHVFSLIALS